jgi:hypothetical protein
MIKRLGWLAFGFVASIGIVHGAPWSGYARVGNAGALDAPFYFTVRKDRIEGLLFRLDSSERLEVQGRVSHDGRFHARLRSEIGGAGRLTGAVQAGRLIASGKIRIGPSRNAELRLRTKIADDEREWPNLEGRYFLMGDGPLDETSYVNLRRIGDAKGVGRYEFSIDLNSSHDTDYYIYPTNILPLVMPLTGGGVWFFLDPELEDPWRVLIYNFPDEQVNFRIVIETPEGKVIEELEGYRLP